jgi:hypothetical protein
VFRKRAGMSPSLQNAADQDQFEAADRFDDGALTAREFGGIARLFGKRPPVAAASHEILARCKCGVEMIGEHVNRQGRTHSLMCHLETPHFCSND